MKNFLIFVVVFFLSCTTVKWTSKSNKPPEVYNNYRSFGVPSIEQINAITKQQGINWVLSMIDRGKISPEQGMVIIEEIRRMEDYSYKAVVFYNSCGYVSSWKIIEAARADSRARARQYDLRKRRLH